MVPDGPNLGRHQRQLERRPGPAPSVLWPDRRAHSNRPLRSHGKLPKGRLRLPLDDLSNNYFVRNGKADEWAEKYADRIQQHLDAKEESFSIDADNQLFPPSISGIQNGIIAYAMNQREWTSSAIKVEFLALSKVMNTESNKWTATYSFKVGYSAKNPSYIVHYHETISSKAMEQITPV